LNKSYTMKITNNNVNRVRKRSKLTSSDQKVSYCSPFWRAILRKMKFGSYVVMLMRVGPKTEPTNRRLRKKSAGKEDQSGSQELKKKRAQE